MVSGGWLFLAFVGGGISGVLAAALNLYFQELRTIGKTEPRILNLTAVADELLTSQLGMSEHTEDLRYELGAEALDCEEKLLLTLIDPPRANESRAISREWAVEG